jgi:pyruvate formate lyase activating enzyme
MLDWPGKVCSVVFLAGCNFRCPACHNHRLVIDPMSMPDYPVASVLQSLLRRSQWIDGITITGGEPTLRTDLPELVRLLRGTGVAVKLDTNGSRPEQLERLLADGLLDAVAMDVKAPLTEKEYARLAGLPVSVKAVQRSIETLKAADTEVTFRTTVIPGLVEEPQLLRISDSLGEVKRYSIQSFRAQSTLDPAFENIPEFSPARFERMKRLFGRPGIEIERFSLAHAG